MAGPRRPQLHQVRPLPFLHGFADDRSLGIESQIPHLDNLGDLVWYFNDDVFALKVCPLELAMSKAESRRT